MEKWIRFFFRYFINFYPPFLGAGIRVVHVSLDRRKIRVEMPLRFYNRNYVGTQFGGSLYSMTDPWFMYMLIENLGENYIVWDKGATIRFIKPGKKKVLAEFAIREEELDEIKGALVHSRKYEKTFHASIVDEEGTLIAEVDKLIYVRTKSDSPKPFDAPSIQK